MRAKAAPSTSQRGRGRERVSAPDVTFSIYEAIFWIAFGEGPQPRDERACVLWDQAEAELHRSLLMGEVTAYGLKDGKGAAEPIPSEAWEGIWIEALSGYIARKSQGEGQPCASEIGRKLWTNIWLYRAQVVGQWPEPVRMTIEDAPAWWTLTAVQAWILARDPSAVAALCRRLSGPDRAGVLLHAGGSARAVERARLELINALGAGKIKAHGDRGNGLEEIPAVEWSSIKHFYERGADRAGVWRHVVVARDEVLTYWDRLQAFIGRKWARPKAPADEPKRPFQVDRSRARPRPKLWGPLKSYQQLKNWLVLGVISDQPTELLIGLGEVAPLVDPAVVDDAIYGWLCSGRLLARGRQQMFDRFESGVIDGQAWSTPRFRADSTWQTIGAEIWPDLAICAPGNWAWSRLCPIQGDLDDKDREGYLDLQFSEEGAQALAEELDHHATGPEPEAPDPAGEAEERGGSDESGGGDEGTSVAVVALPKAGKQRRNLSERELRRIVVRQIAGLKRAGEPKGFLGERPMWKAAVKAHKGKDIAFRRYKKMRDSLKEQPRGRTKERFIPEHWGKQGNPHN